MRGRILVTGATGTVGSELVKVLVSRGAQVRAAIHTPAHADGPAALDVETVPFGYERPETLDAAVQEAERIFVVAPDGPFQKDLVAPLISAAQRAGVRHLVKLSGIKADEEPGVMFARWNRETERAMLDSGIPCTFLRPNTFMQNFIKMFAPSIRWEGRISMPLGEGKVSYIDARDIARVAAEVLLGDAHIGAAYDLTGPHALSSREVADVISQALGRTIIYEDIPEEMADAALRSAGVPEWAVTAIADLQAANKAGRMAVLSTAVQDVTGQPPIPFARFVADHLAAFR